MRRWPIVLVFAGMAMAQTLLAVAPALAQSNQESLAAYSGAFSAANDPAYFSLCRLRPDFEGVQNCFLSGYEQDGGSWGAWINYADMLRGFGQLDAAAKAYRKAFELKQRCALGTTVHCSAATSSAAWERYYLVGAAMAYLQVGDYAGAAEAYRSAVNVERENVDLEWLAVARFGASDAQTSWREYRELFTGTPFPRFNQEGLSERDARRLTEPPEGFYRLLKAGMNNLRHRAYSKDHLFYEYFHAQNAVRAEALMKKTERKRYLPIPYESTEARDNLIAIYLKIKDKYSHDQVFFAPESSAFSSLPSHAVRPAISSYALDAAGEAHKAVKRRNYQEAENALRLALATDPWWLDAQYELAKFEFINYGWCGPDETLYFIEELLEQGVVEQTAEHSPSVMHRYVDSFQKQLDDIWNEAAESGSTRLQGWCDIEGAVPIRPGVEVR